MEHSMCHRSEKSLDSIGSELLFQTIWNDERMHDERECVRDEATAKGTERIGITRARV